MTPYSEALSPDRIENLRALAGKLLTVPDGQFDMDFFRRDSSGRTCYVEDAGCGTAGCAIGWGPAAGVEVGEQDCDWWDYSYRVFIPARDSSEWDWCFSAGWARTDNTPTGAALRILYLLNIGLPENAYEQMDGLEPLCYREVAS